ncbi:MAG: hypothetical protein A3D96_07305 [Chlamydiae bacterium RIFCSPHIGHO2_12_FULL_44_59]|nr:MAG: hypothetical protein A3C42_02400 [Chlamydiae bacterium RIFCSPHIGHO2_02_FULL_45_9]OGN56841.1 MAG: hypothetical protein A2796_06615 [Chlamydiae bacterium RIFCSPHIGHO2_01_FULL_44_39]OGN59500.1 MAG: hypothetical protein A3D96_07305 [Chlamydiae bacterium RIFCSPHIGHO2_12_FULL_44_59]OGN67245.1 MAG: hypothetical protein A2978_03135 [Chlamydiae bacterium RIFCSPLOWO2_01_FULL_44_52]OGN68667.1 MAG: hypothetical protein A3I67_02865 [Chlamydiae bacterium RIFCSPLOWO2_02_FULL_45_22]OGN69188.1 MAG: hyp
MSISLCSAENQNPSTAARPDYGPLGVFGNSKVTLAGDPFSLVLSFLTPKELTQAECVCNSWKEFIWTTGQWKKQCQNQLNIPASIDPISFLPQGSASYKEHAKLPIKTKVYDASIYRDILGTEIELVPPLLKAQPLTRAAEPDPCGPAQTKGQKYVWMSSPSYFNVSADEDFPFELDKPDDPNDEEAPRLIQKEVGLVERFKRKVGLGSKLEKKILQVPNTINNLPVLFGHPKNGNLSKYNYVWKTISSQHGNKRIPAGPICMREDVIGRNLTFAQQQAAATEAGVVIPQLGHRILYNFLRQAKTNTYPDGQNPWTYARTSTITVDSQGTPWQSVCGGGGPSGLDADCYVGNDDIGVAVAL